MKGVKEKKLLKGNEPRIPDLGIGLEPSTERAKYLAIATLFFILIINRRDFSFHIKKFHYSFFRFQLPK